MATLGCPMMSMSFPPAFFKACSPGCRFLDTPSWLCDMWKWSEERRLLKRKKAPTVDISSSTKALGLPFSEEDWKATPTAVRRSIIEDKKTIAELSERVKELERRVEKLLKRNFSNSDQPSSSDSPYRKPRASKEKGKKPQRKKGHPGAKLNEPFALEFCGGEEVRVPGSDKSEFCRCAIPVSSNASPPLMSL